MDGERRAPSHRSVIWTIARRELGIAARRRVVKFLFLVSLLPPLVMGVVLVVRVMAREATGMDLGFDPVLWLLRIQAGVVMVFCLGIGPFTVARDRSEDVLYLYAVRPVSPFTYMAGKMVAVALPAGLLLFIPSVLIALVREGILDEAVQGAETFLIIAKAGIASVLLGTAYAGVTVGPSALMRRGRWALVIALLLFWMPEPLKLAKGTDGLAIGPASAAQDLLSALFNEQTALLGVASAVVLGLYALVGGVIIRARARQEMRP